MLLILGPVSILGQRPKMLRALRCEQKKEEKEREKKKKKVDHVFIKNMVINILGFSAKLARLLPFLSAVAEGRGPRPSRRLSLSVSKTGFPKAG